MYAELHCKTSFSFQQGASQPEELVLRAAELNYAALAITDVNSLAGVVRAHGVAKEVGLKLLIGAEITPHDAPPAVLLATDRAAYGRLARLITLGRREAEKGSSRLSFDDIATYHEGLLALAVPREPVDYAQQPDSPHHAPRRESDVLRRPELLGPYRDLFGDRGYLLGELSRGADDARRLDQLRTLARTYRLPLVAAGDVHYHAPERRPLHDVLTAIRWGTTVDEVRDRLYSNAERHLKTIPEVHAQFAAAADAVARTLELADRCTFSLDELRYEYPEELAPAGRTPIEYLTELAWRGAARRWPEGLSDKVRGLIEHELALIRELRYEAYFLTVWDLVRFARRRGILCQGRGSAANSVVCYCLGVTSVDPARMDLLFERFVSRERNEAPDIDIDFEHERREEVLQYIYEKYGRDRVGMTAEVITYRARSAVRDVGKALGLSLDRVDTLAKNLDRSSSSKGATESADKHDTTGEAAEPRPAAPAGDAWLAERCRESGIDPASRVGRQLLALVEQLIGFPRHLSQHVGGMVMTQGPLCELVPIENAAMEGRTVIQWNKDDLDELGILKVDCLGLGMLTAIRKCFELVAEHGYPDPPHNRSRRRRKQAVERPRQLTLANVPAEDPDVYDMICRAETMGVFQIESRAQMSMLPRLRPRNYHDLVVEVAIVRPGPIQGNMVHPYLRRRMGLEQPHYPDESIRQVLGKTLGVPLFQEQAMRLAMVAAGFTPGEADQLRRAMGAWRRTGVIDQFRQRLIDGMRQRGFTDEFAESVFTQIRGFGEYGFPESHAASFALLVYVSAWLKWHHPAAFAAALVNSQPMGFYAPAQLIGEARERGVEIRGVDINASQWDCTLEPIGSGCADGQLALRLGFRQVVGLARRDAERLLAARCDADGRPRPFRSIEQCTRRAGLGQAVVVRLAKAGVFASIATDRRGAVWNAMSQEKRPREMPLFADCEDEDDLCAALPAMPAQDEVFADYRTTGLSLRGHPIEFLRDDLNELGIAPADQLARWPNNRPISVAGIVLLRQRPSTARGITFVTLEDETGTINLVIRQDVWERFRKVARTASSFIAHGRLERKQQVIHVLVQRLEDLSSRVKQLRHRSRDFR